MEREGFVRWRNNGWQWVGWNVDRNTWCKVMGSMIDCRWMQVYEHTEWNQGSTGWLVGRIELITEDCRSEMNSAKITNITQTISNNLKSIHRLMILESYTISKMTGLKRKTLALVLISGVQWNEQQIDTSDYDHISLITVCYTLQRFRTSLRHRSHIHISALVFTSFSSLFSVISLNFSSTKLIHCISVPNWFTVFHAFFRSWHTSIYHNVPLWVITWCHYQSSPLRSRLIDQQSTSRMSISTHL